MRLRTQVSEPVVDEYLCHRGASGSGHRLPFVDRFKMLVKPSHREGKIQDSLEGRMQGTNKAWWRDVKICRCQGRAMAGKMQKNGGSSVQCICSALVVKMGAGVRQ